MASGIDPLGIAREVIDSLANEALDLSYKLRYLLRYMYDNNHLPNRYFTFPDGDTWVPLEADE